MTIILGSMTSTALVVGVEAKEEAKEEVKAARARVVEVNDQERTGEAKGASERWIRPGTAPK